MTTGWGTRNWVQTKLTYRHLLRRRRGQEHHFRSLRGALAPRRSVIAYTAPTVRGPDSQQPKMSPIASANAILLTAPIVVVGWVGWTRRWVVDDAFISFRSIDNLLAGNGPVFNAGERVEVSTSTLWHYLLALFAATRAIVPVEWWSVIIGLGMTIGGLVLGQRGALLLIQRRPGQAVLPLAAIVVAALPPFWDFATSGLETGLSFFWLGACFWGLARHHARRRTPIDPGVDGVEGESLRGPPTSRRTWRAGGAAPWLPCW